MTILNNHKIGNTYYETLHEPKQPAQSSSSWIPALPNHIQDNLLSVYKVLSNCFLFELLQLRSESRFNFDYLFAEPTVVFSITLKGKVSISLKGLGRHEREAGESSLIYFPKGKNSGFFEKGNNEVLNLAFQNSTIPKLVNNLEFLIRYKGAIDRQRRKGFASRPIRDKECVELAQQIKQDELSGFHIKKEYQAFCLLKRFNSLILLMLFNEFLN